ncbi:MAG: GPW/gp25 family protein [Rikenellaceae bacterium]
MKSIIGNGWAFPPELEQGGSESTKMVSDEENIRQSLWVLLSTSPGERVHRCDYGCAIRKYAFEEMTISTQTLLRDEIERAVVMFEPRVKLNRVLFTPIERDGVLNIELQYTILQTNRRTNMVYPFYLFEGTDLQPIK